MEAPPDREWTETSRGPVADQLHSEGGGANGAEKKYSASSKIIRDVEAQTQVRSTEACLIATCLFRFY